MAVRGNWTRVAVDGDRCLVYGPRLGRLYLLALEESSKSSLQAVLGLRRFAFCEDLPDPVTRIVCDLSSLKAAAPVKIGFGLPIAYRLLHLSRNILPFAVTAKLVRALVRWRGRRLNLTLWEIGRLICGVESAVGIADCYPRALMTCYLCLRSNRDCELVIGTLAPTRKMHAWCSSDGQLAYEALPEHYMYRPLMIMPLKR